MGFVLSKRVALFLVLVLLPPSIRCLEEPVAYSKATYYNASDGLGIPNGECGYGEYGRTINDGDVALVSSSKLYRGGAGCGACYQIKCKEEECNDEGVKVVVTDHGRGTSDTNFILSSHAFNRLAQPGLENMLMAYGKVDIQYQRVDCHYQGKNLMLKVEEHSHFHSYLAFQFLYKAGTSDMTAVELFEDEALEWRPCRRAYGAVWDISNPPKGSLTVRIFLDGSASERARWVLVPKVIPAFWNPGAAYDTSLQLD